MLGVDGGGSKTHALVLDEAGHALGFGQAGTGNYQVNGLEAAMREIERAVRAALDQSGTDEVELGCFCLSGADLPEDYERLRRALEATRLTRRVLLKNDTLAALRSGLTRPWGVVVICGSGFNAAGIGRDGRELILPGLGSISGDWGGGSDLADEMIRLIMRAWDGRGQSTLLAELVLDALRLPSPEALMQRLYRRQIDSRGLLDLAPLLFVAAEAGDGVAQDLVIRMGTEVGVTAVTLLRRLELLDEPVEAVLAGSVFKARGRLLVDTVARHLRAGAPHAQIVRPRYEPVVGAALLALEALGVAVTPAHAAQLAATLSERLVLAA